MGLARDHVGRILVIDEGGRLQGGLSLSDRAQLDGGRHMARTLREVTDREVRTVHWPANGGDEARRRSKAMKRATLERGSAQATWPLPQAGPLAERASEPKGAGEATMEDGMITLNEAEVRALKRILDGYLPELSYDLARIDRERDRHDLAEMERTLRALREKLERETSMPQSSPPELR